VRRFAALAALAALLALIAGACSRASGPVEVDPALVPFDVARSATPSPEVPSQTLSIYLIRDARLIAAPRTVSADAPTPEAALSALFQGPTTQERTDGLETAIPPATQLVRITVLDSVAEIDLTDEFQNPAAPEEVLQRIAQVVWTLAGVPGVMSVRFSIDGDPIAVPTDLDAAATRPVTPADYASIAPPADVSGP
jgi:spore germination protein GerM